jgi:hypothetical protein
MGSHHQKTMMYVSEKQIQTVKRKATAHAGLVVTASLVYRRSLQGYTDKVHHGRAM